jgi:hypothetical protein
VFEFMDVHYCKSAHLIVYNYLDALLYSLVVPLLSHHSFDA